MEGCGKGFIRASTAGWSREGVVLLCTALLWPHLSTLCSLGATVQTGHKAARERPKGCKDEVSGGQEVCEER